MNQRLLISVFVLLVSSLFAQQWQGQGQRRGNFFGTITGYVYDEASQKPIEYANIILYSQRDSSQVTGTVTGKNGVFELTPVRPGNFYMKIHFIGFKSHLVPDIQIRPNNPKVSIGEVALKLAVLSSEGVEVVAEKVAMEYHIDKKVINVSQQSTSISGTAVDVLENVPSVTVDVEGNVSLRGSESFTVLIDGRPSVLDANDALQQIPAGSIENIEIITNPSAKYDPDGTSGIINVLMKKNQGATRSGIVNLNAGSHDRYGGDFVLTLKRDKINYTFGADYNKMNFPGSRYSERETTLGNNTSYIYSSGDDERGFDRYGIRASIDVQVTEKDQFILGGRLGSFEMHNDSESKYNTWNASDLIHSYYTAYNFGTRTRDYYTTHLDYIHKFNDNGHELSGQVYYSSRDSDDNSKTEQFDTNDIQTYGSETIEAGPGEQWRGKLEYTLPIKEKSKFESGYQLRMSESEDVTSRSEYDVDLDAYVYQSLYSYIVNYERTIQSLYGTYSSEFNKLGYQLGLRGEYTDRLIRYKDKAEEFTIDRWDLFPTLHMSYDLAEKRQMMLSYTRRIQRPRGYYLEPFETWMDAYTVRRGNPDLKPEYIDSYEAGFNSYFGRNLFSAEVYYRINNNKIERVRSAYDVDVTLETVANVGKDYALGSEIMLNILAIKWWNFNWMTNLYQYKVEGQLFDEDFSRESFNWNMRFNNTFKITPSTRFQMNLMYNSPTVSAQGRREGFMMTNIAVRQEFFDHKFSATFQVRDLFQNSKHESWTEGQNYTAYNRFTRDTPFVSMTLTYNINNYKKDRRNMNGDSVEMEGMDEGGEF